MKLKGSLQPNALTVDSDSQQPTRRFPAPRPPSARSRLSPSPDGSACGSSARDERSRVARTNRATLRPPRYNGPPPRPLQRRAYHRDASTPDAFSHCFNLAATSRTRSVAARFTTKAFSHAMARRSWLGTRSTDDGSSPKGTSHDGQSRHELAPTTSLDGLTNGCCHRRQSGEQRRLWLGTTPATTRLDT